MLRRLRIPLTLISLAVLLILLGYWKSNMSNEPNTAKADTIDFFVINAQAVQYQDNGTPKHEMTADKLEHLQSRDITLLSGPELLLFRPSAQPLHARSKFGEVGPQEEVVELVEEVRVEHPDSRGSTAILTTNQLTVFPNQNYAETQQAVVIETTNGITTATGMKAYLNNGRIHLLSNMRGQYEVR